VKNTLVVMTTNRTPVPEFEQMIAALRAAGAAYLPCPGWTDVARGRSVALSSACDVLRQHVGRADVVLMMDDDMAMEPAGAQMLVSAARLSGEPCSAVYATAEIREGQHGQLAGTRLEGQPGRWLMGLGCLAIPAGVLLELERTSEPFALEQPGAAPIQYREFTWSRADGGRWVSEDYRLCLRLGGVRLLPIPCGHKKAIMLWPDDATLAEVRRQNGNS